MCHGHFTGLVLASNLGEHQGHFLLQLLSSLSPASRHGAQEEKGNRNVLRQAQSCIPLLDAPSSCAAEIPAGKALSLPGEGTLPCCSSSCEPCWVVTQAQSQKKKKNLLMSSVENPHSFRFLSVPRPSFVCVLSC